MKSVNEAVRWTKPVHGYRRQNQLIECYCLLSTPAPVMSRRLEQAGGGRHDDHAGVVRAEKQFLAEFVQVHICVI